MSEMQIFHGYFEKSNLDITPEDTDDFYELEEKIGCHFVRVNGDLYRFWKSSVKLDVYGFSEVLPNTSHEQLILFWYNGGAGLHEVAEEAIKRHLKASDQPQIT